MEQVLWPTSVELNAEDELLVLTFSEFLPLGEAILGMEFQGTLNDQMRGFYRRFAFKTNNSCIPVNWNIYACSLCISSLPFRVQPLFISF